MSDTAFTGSIPELYDTYLVPLIFQPYAEDLAVRVAAIAPSRVLEIACGTGVVTRALAKVLPASTQIVATDLNPAMLAQASRQSIARAVTWRPADASQLPFSSGEFDVVVCQFGVMFFPDKAAAFAESRRVLRPGGTLVFSVWDRIGENELADVITDEMAALFPDDPPRFLARTPHGYFDRAQISHDVAAGGFPSSPQIETVTFRSKAAGADIPAVAYCQGTPLRGEIESRGASRLSEASAAAAGAIVRRFGPGVVDAKIQAHVVSAVA